MSTDPQDIHFKTQAEADQYYIDSQISTSKKAPRITRSRTKLLTTLEQRRDALLASVYSVPDDVLSLIFQAGALGKDVVDIQFSVLVSSVVSRWRRVALSTPSLWTSLEIDVPETGLDRQMWTTFTDRTSSLPLSIRIALCGSVKDFPLDYPPLNLSVVLARGRTLTLEAQSVFDGPTRVHPPRTPFASQIPFEQLCLSSMFFESFASLLDLLRACPCLVSLVLKRISIKYPAHPVNQVVRLQCLSTLNVEVYEFGGGLESSMHPLLKALQPPSVSNLSLRGWDHVLEPSMDFSFVSSLVITSITHPTAAVIIEFISRMPLLESLVLHATIGLPNDDFPRNVSIPPLVSIDFCASKDVDRLARWLVEQTGRGRPEDISVKTVKLASSAGGSVWGISESNRQWMEERGFEVLMRHEED